MKKKLQLILAGFILLSFLSVSAQQQSLTGVVAGNTGFIEQVRVQVVNNGQYAITDSLGQFELKNLPIGIVQIKWSRMGFYDRVEKVTIKAGENALPTVYLVSNTITFKEITVNGKRQPSNIISTLDLQLRPVGSSQDLLPLGPGLFIAQHAGGGKAEQIFLRGFDVDHGTDFAIYVDGIPVNMPSHAHGQGYADLHFLIPETVKELEVNKGPHHTNYGDLATAGSGEFRTLTSLDKNVVKAEVGMFNTQRILGMFNVLHHKHLFSTKEEHLYIAGEIKRSDAYFQQAQDFKRFNVFSKYTGELNNGDKLMLSVSSFKSQWDASGQIPNRKVMDATISRYGSIDPTEGGQTGRTNFNVIHERKLGNSRLKNQFFYSRYDFELFSNFTFFLHDTINGDQISQVDQRNVLGYNSTLETTHQLFSKALTSIMSVGVRYDNANIQLNSTVKRELLYQKVNGKLNQVNTWLYADETMQLKRNLKLNVGTRLDFYHFDFRNNLVDSVSGEAAKAIVSPKANLTYSVSKNMDLFVKSGFGFHSNDARAVVLGQLENTLARAFGNEVGLIAKPFNKLLVNMALWSMDLQSELVYVGDEGIVEATGRTRRIGVDVGLRYQLFEHLFLDADVNINKGWLRDEPQEANRIPLAPSFTSIGGITYKKWKGLSGSLRYRYMGDRAATEDNAIVAEGYFLTDVVVNYTYRSMMFSFSVENMLNAQWKEAQFATESRLQGEEAAVNEIHFTPGTPLFIKGGITYSF